MNDILDKVKNTRILAAVGIACMILGTMFGYVKFEFFGLSESLSLWGYWEGKIVMLLAVANLLLIFKDMVEKYVPSLFKTSLGKKLANVNNPKLSLIPTILAVVLTIYLHGQLDIDSDYMSYGLGFYSLWLGAILLVAHAIVYKENK